MYQTIIPVLIFIFKTLVVISTLSILVFIHELGHFLAARFFGVRVLEFSFGMGKLLYSRQVKETSYQIRAIPMGGFVKMAGEEGISDENYIPEKDEFFGISPLKRIFIVFAGPLMNIFLALFCFWMAVFFMGEDLTKPVAGYIEENSTVKNIIHSGDTILQVNGQRVESFEEFSEIISELSEFSADLQILRSGEKIKLTAKLYERDSLDLLGQPVKVKTLGISPFFPPLVGAVMKDSAAEKSGIIPGDLITEIDGKELSFWNEISLFLQENKKKDVQLKVLRDGEVHMLTLTPEQNKQGVSILGISLKIDGKMVFHRDLKAGQAFKQALIKLGQNTLFTYKALMIMIRGGISKDSLMGPVRLAGMVSSFADHGFFPWLILLGFISHQLAIINFLPFPALDGGHACFFMMEIIRRKPLKFKTQEKITRFGFAFLISLFIFVVINDITSLIGK